MLSGDLMADFRQPFLDYAEQERESERVAREQRLFSGYRRSLDGPMHPQVEHEGSWLNSKHNPKN